MKELFGSYPDIINNPGDEQSRLEELAGSYLFKDIYALDGLKKSSLVEKLIYAVAMQLDPKSVIMNLREW